MALWPLVLENTIYDQIETIAYPEGRKEMWKRRKTRNTDVVENSTPNKYKYFYNINNSMMVFVLFF